MLYSFAMDDDKDLKYIYITDSMPWLFYINEHWSLHFKDNFSTPSMLKTCLASYILFVQLNTKTFAVLLHAFVCKRTSSLTLP